MTITWPNIEPRVRSLLEADLAAEDVPAWLAQRDALERDVGEAHAMLMRKTDEDTGDTVARDAYLTFVRTVMPHLAEASVALDRRLLAVPGYQPPSELRGAWQHAQDDVAVFHPDNVPLQTQEAELGQRYDELMGSVRADLDGAMLTLSEARERLKQPDPALRERTWRAMQAGLDGVRPELDTIFLELLRLRQRMARNAGFDDYRAFVWRERHRHEYTPADALALHAAVREHAVPALRQLQARRRQRLGLERLRPWDLDVDPDGGEPLTPFSDVPELEQGLVRMFAALDPALAERFERLRGDWLDLVTLRHEAGHAFHAMLTEERWPLQLHAAQRPESWELASQALELLTLPFLEKARGGFYQPDDARRSTRALLARVIELWVRTSAIDAFQHWLYLQDPDTLTVDAIDAAWTRISDELGGATDWSGFERERAKAWQIIHVFRIPFYFLEYGIASIGAVQVWRNALDDHAGALAAYQRFLSLGGTVPLDEAYATAGARFGFDAETVGDLVAFTMAQLEAAGGCTGAGT